MSAGARELLNCKPCDLERLLELHAWKGGVRGAAFLPLSYRPELKR